MKTYAAPVTATLGSASIAIVQLVALAFSTPIYLNTSNWDLTFDGNVYKGAYGLGAISAVTDKPGEIQGLTLDMFGDVAHVALALDGADEVQGTICTIRTAIIETENYTVLDAPVEWLGTLDTMTIGEDGQTANIHVTAEAKAVDLLRGTPQFYTEADQILINATDHSFQYVTDQVDKPVVWPAKTFFQK